MINDFKTALNAAIDDVLVNGFRQWELTKNLCIHVRNSKYLCVFGMGKFFFYEPAKLDNQVRQRALRDSGVHVETCGFCFEEKCDYDSFYAAAIKHIEKEINSR